MSKPVPGPRHPLTIQRREHLLRVLKRCSNGSSGLATLTLSASASTMPSLPANMSLVTRRTPLTLRQLTPPSSSHEKDMAAWDHSVQHYQSELRAIEAEQAEALQSKYHDQVMRDKQSKAIRTSLQQFTDAMLARPPDDAYMARPTTTWTIDHGCINRNSTPFSMAWKRAVDLTAPLLPGPSSSRKSTPKWPMFGPSSMPTTACTFKYACLIHAPNPTNQRRCLMNIKATHRLQMHQRQLQTLETEAENRAFADLVDEERRIQDRRVALRQESKLRTRKQHQAALLDQIQTKARARDTKRPTDKRLPPNHQVQAPWWTDASKAFDGRNDDYAPQPDILHLAAPVKRFGRKGAPWFDE
ncbi:Aste57867_11746 [Aphanomyces stellatus]|uniref:Aste57867_11746 protein n=1 Tax=Aphanomyces stellatus TaxID=120398 RepID=A0A485KTS6_9STRA|nr:hypothetical protein As57867_011701 [Aphanomyces stellatus]VFT88602.1 Aste57867_11746 [Aphanomyces stellatus]